MELPDCRMPTRNRALEARFHTDRAKAALCFNLPTTRAENVVISYRRCNNKAWGMVLCLSRATETNLDSFAGVTSGTSGLTLISIVLGKADCFYLPQGTPCPVKLTAQETSRDKLFGCMGQHWKLGKEVLLTHSTSHVLTPAEGKIQNKTLSALFAYRNLP